jgi:hypothetical protein
MWTSNLYPARTFISVLLPAPDGPMIAKQVRNPYFVLTQLSTCSLLHKDCVHEPVSCPGRKMPDTSFKICLVLVVSLDSY